MSKQRRDERSTSRQATYLHTCSHVILLAYCTRSVHLYTANILYVLREIKWGTKISGQRFFPETQLEIVSAFSRFMKNVILLCCVRDREVNCRDTDARPLSIRSNRDLWPLFKPILPLWIVLSCGKFVCSISTTVLPDGCHKSRFDFNNLINLPNGLQNMLDSAKSHVTYFLLWSAKSSEILPKICYSWGY